MYTLGGSFLALLLQGDGGAAPEIATFSVVEALAKSTWVARSVLVVLLLFSIASWSIFLYKWWTFRRSEGQTARFLDVFRRSSKFSEVQAVCRSLGDSPLVGLFQAGYAELTAQLRQNTSSTTDAAEGHPRNPPPRPIVKSLPAVDRALMRASVVEVSKLEHRLTVLATTASVTPFIGLLGTVWGILITFGTIGEMGSTNLAVVAPGIAEALITTAAGLFAAIPAVGFYNHLSHRVKNFASEMDDFSMEFLNIAERNFT